MGGVPGYITANKFNIESPVSSFLLRAFQEWACMSNFSDAQDATLCAGQSKDFLASHVLNAIPYSSKFLENACYDYLSNVALATWFVKIRASVLAS